MAARARARAIQMRDVLAWRDVQVVVALFCAAQLLDGITTYLALTSHRFQEGNPLLSGSSTPTPWRPSWSSWPSRWSS